MKIPKRTKYLILGAMILIAIALRYPFTPHEIGWDSFQHHGIVNAMNQNGQLAWWVHPLSPFGLTPFSYGSSVPVIVSALSQGSGLSIESSIWLFSTLCGVISVFAAYLVAKEVFKNDLYVLFVVFAFMSSEELLNYTTWTLSTRGLFITMLPFFLFFLFRNTRYDNLNKFTALIIIYFVFLVSVHHLYSFLTLPLVIYIIFVKLDKVYPVENIIKNEKANRMFNKILEYIPLVLIFLILTGFFANIEMFNIVEAELEEKNTVIESTIRIYARNLGIMGLFGIFGYFLLAYRMKDSLNQILLLLFTVVCIPFILISTYMTAFIAIFIYLLSGFALYAIFMFFHKRNKKIIGMILIFLILIISLGFSAFYQVNHPGVQDDIIYNDLYMEEPTYDSGLWLKQYNNDSVSFTVNVVTESRVSGVMNLKIFPGQNMDQIEYGFVSPNDLENEVRSPFDAEFWSDNFYETKYVGPDLGWHGRIFQRQEYDNSSSLNYRNKYNIKYCLINEIWLENNEINGTLFVTLKDDTYNIYSNEKYSIWYIF